MNSYLLVWYTDVVPSDRRAAQEYADLSIV